MFVLSMLVLFFFFFSSIFPPGLENRIITIAPVNDKDE